MNIYRKEDVERCKQSDLLEELLREMAGEFPELSRIFVEERDQYMVNGLRTVLRKTTIDKRNAWTATDGIYSSLIHLYYLLFS
jgi:pheromone shutdown protein TraB